MNNGDSTINNSGRAPRGGPASARGGFVCDEKRVRFAEGETVHPLPDVPRASDMTPAEKLRLWRTREEYDRSKLEAAECAGIAIGRGGPRLVAAGDFDAAGDGGPGGRPRYNENEYSDGTLPDGGAACKRGLGYHFSRARREARATARSAVLAWQKALATGGAATDGDGPEPAEGARTLLALASAKLSRVPAAEARWRGDVDYRVAYPGRGGARAEAGSGAKRRSDDVVSVGRGRKRRRMAVAGGAGTCGSGARGGIGLSPAAVGYLNGILRAKV